MSEAMSDGSRLFAICLRVERSGAQDLLVTEASRRGLRYGLSEAGPWDVPAFRAAVRALSGADPRAESREPVFLEMTVSGPVLTVEGEGIPLGTVAGLAVVTGAFHAELQGGPVRQGVPFPVQVGDRIVLRRDLGLRGYLGVAGGFALPTVLGTSGADLPAGLPGLAGRSLAAGDRLPLRPLPGLGDAGQSRTRGPDPGPEAGAGPSLPAAAGGSGGSGGARCRVLPGPHLGRLSRLARRALLGTVWTVSPQSNRVGIRLAGEPVADRPDLRADLPSEPTVLGTVQLPPDGSPIILGPDRGSLGGYLKVLTVAGADVYRLSQMRPGERLRFVPAGRSWAVSDRERALHGDEEPAGP